MKTNATLNQTFLTKGTRTLLRIFVHAILAILLPAALV